MYTKYARVTFDVDCEWEGLPPVYRIYVNEELFAERTWVYINQYLKETLQIQALPGKYHITLEKVGPDQANFTISNPKIAQGRARWLDFGLLEIVE